MWEKYRKMKMKRRFKVFIFCLIIIFSFVLIPVIYGKEVNNLRENANLSAIARKLLGDRLFEKRAIQCGPERRIKCVEQNQ